MASNMLSINVKQVHKTFNKNINALNGVSLQFNTGVMHGIIGPEGAGKTTLLRIILSLLKPTAGSVEFKRDNQLIDFDEIRSTVAYMPQQQSLYADLSIGEHLAFFKDLYGISGNDYEQKKAELLHITRLSEFIDRPAGKLSGGMYKKLGLMCALLRSPRVILLDEPTNGVDPISRREFWELLYRLADQNILIILTTAYMDEAERCGHVHLLEQGNLIADGDARQLLDDAQVQNFDELFLQRGQNERSR